MTLFIRISVWLTITLIAYLVTSIIGMFMTKSTDSYVWLPGACISSIIILGGSLTVNLIQAGII